MMTYLRRGGWELGSTIGGVEEEAVGNIHRAVV